MALCPPVQAKFEGLSEGPHVAVCDMVVDLGMQETFYGTKHQIFIRFEVSSERIKYTGDDGKDCEGPRVIGKFYTNSLAEGSTLRKDLESWRGKKFADDELLDQSGKPIYDVTKVVGAPCQIGVIKNDKGNSNIATIMGLPKGFPRPTLENEAIVYDADNPDSFNKLSQKMQHMITGGKKEAEQESNNDSAAHANQSLPVDTTQHAPATADFDDDIPF